MDVITSPGVAQANELEFLLRPVVLQRVTIP
jgi:hypothetical protein